MNSLKIIENINYSIGKNLIIDISRHHNLETEEINFIIDKFLNRTVEILQKKKLVLD